MDFHILTRKELQSLCKLNKIPANITNVAMADALQSLDIVEGIEKFLKVSQSETLVLDESKENVEVSSPRVPTTRCRTTTRQKVKTTEEEKLQLTETKTTRRGTSKKLAGGVEESKNEVLETPALSSTRRRALATSSCRNVNSQLNDCELEAIEDQKSPAAVATKSRRKVATTTTTVKKESTVQKTYGTRRSTRQTEKKSGEPKVRKESEKAVKINSMLDEVIVISDEILAVEVPESTVNAGNLNTEVDDICNAFEELDVVVDINEEKEDSEEEKQKDDVKPEPDSISTPCENGDLEGEKLESEVMVLEEHPDSILDDNTHTESDTIADNNEDLNGSPDNDMILDNTVNSINENDFSPVDESTNDIKEESEKMVDETIDSLSPIIEGVEDIFKEKADDGFEGSSNEEKKQFSPSPSDLIGHPTHVTPMRKSLSKNDTPALSSTRRKAPATSSCRKIDSQMNVSSQKSECKLSSPETAVTSSWRKGPSTTIKKEGTLQKAYSSRRSSKESEEAVKIDLMLDDQVINATSEEVLSVEVSENSMDAGDPNAEVEEICSRTLENLDVVVEETAVSTVETVMDMEAVHESEVKEDASDDENLKDFDMILDNIENPSESLNSEIETNFSPADKETLISDNNENSIDDVIYTVEDLKPEVVFSVEEKNQISQNTSMKQISSSIVSDDKENSVMMVFGKKGEKEKDNDVISSLEDISLRQLRKQVKALTLKCMNGNNHDAAATKENTARPALQALCENKPVVGGW